MKAQAIGLSHKGYCRKKNEDSYHIDEKNQMFILCDGMGGALGGEIASALAVKTIQEEMTQTDEGKEPSEKLKQAFERANYAVWQKGQTDETVRGMGTTATAAWLCGDRLFTAHVGDSSLFLFRDGNGTKLTCDHTVAERLRQEVHSSNPEEFSTYAHVLTRALGMEKDVAVDVFSNPLKTGDRLVLSSDGLTNMMTLDEIRAVACSAEGMREKAEKLIQTALERGGYDNITVIFVQIQEGDRS